MKKLIIGLLVAVLAVSMVDLAAAGRQAGEEEIESITFVHYAEPFAGAGLGPVQRDIRMLFDFLERVRWRDTMTYEVNFAGSGVNPEWGLGVLEQSLEVWDEQTRFELFNAPVLNGEAVFGEEMDGVNSVSWEYVPGLIAVNRIFYNRKRREIVESDVMFSTSYRWSIDCETGNCSGSWIPAMDLQNVATHEFGHNGLADLYDPVAWEQTMYGWGSVNETRKRTLESGDIRGIQLLYGRAIF